MNQSVNRYLSEEYTKIHPDQENDGYGENRLGIDMGKVALADDDLI